jgi:hypothetical protein
MEQSVEGTIKRKQQAIRKSMAAGESECMKELEKLYASRATMSRHR